MKPILLIIILFSIALIAGCGGSSGGNNPFTGDYQGDYHATNVSESGVVDMTIDSAGGVIGTITDNSNGVTEDIHGTIQDNGDFTGDFSDPTGSDPFGGNLAYDQNGHLKGEVNVTTASGVIRDQFDLAPVHAKRSPVKRALRSPAAASLHKGFIVHKK